MRCSSPTIASCGAIESDLAAAGVIALSWYDVLLEVRAEPDGIRMQELGERAVLVADVGQPHRRRARGGRTGGATSRPRRRPVRRRAVITAAGERSFREAAPVYLARIKERFTRHLLGLEQRTITAALERVVAANSDRGVRR